MSRRKQKRTPYRYPDIEDLIEKERIKRRKSVGDGCVRIISLLILLVLVATFLIATGTM